jgi:hypothetical protein
VAQNPLVSIANYISGTGKIEIQVLRSDNARLRPVLKVAALTCGGITVSGTVGVFEPIGVEQVENSVIVAGGRISERLIGVSGEDNRRANGRIIYSLALRVRTTRHHRTK